MVTPVRQANISQANTSQANASQANASQANTSQANASQANTSQANASQANTSQANASQANTSQANASQANTSQANASQANTSQANASQANTSQANASQANTSQANASQANTSQANASQANTSQANSSVSQPITRKVSHIELCKLFTINFQAITDEGLFADLDEAPANADPLNSLFNSSSANCTQVNDMQDAERVLDALSEMDDLYSWEQDNASNHVNGNIISINPVCTYIKITESMTTTESTDITNYMYVQAAIENFTRTQATILERLTKIENFIEGYCKNSISD